MKKNQWFTLPDDEEEDYVQRLIPPHVWRQLEMVIEAALRGELTERQFRSLVGADHMAAFAMREVFCRRVSWSVMTAEWIQDVAQMLKGQRVLEIGAGRGILGKVMPALTGAEWICTDLNPPEGADHVVRMRANPAVDRFKPDVVFASWVPYRSTLDYQMARRLPCVFVGESGGCTGSRLFWEGDAPYRIEYPDIQKVPQWPGMHDHTFCTFPT